MPIEVQWDNPEKTILRQKFEGKWTGKDYYVSLDEMSKLLKQVDHRVHLIGDMTHSVGIPALNLLAASGRGDARRVQGGNATVNNPHAFFARDVVRHPG